MPLVGPGAARVDLSAAGALADFGNSIVDKSRGSPFKFRERSLSHLSLHHYDARPVAKAIQILNVSKV
jgi:hypothetical protein